MPYDHKYGRVTLENQRNIADDEPVFVLTAHDALSVYLLRSYHKMCEEAGSPENHLRSIESDIDLFTEWQSSHTVRTPTSTGFEG